MRGHDPEHATRGRSAGAPRTPHGPTGITIWVPAPPRRADPDGASGATYSAEQRALTLLLLVAAAALGVGVAARAADPAVGFSPAAAFGALAAQLHDLGHDLEADALETLSDLSGMHPGVPDIPDREGGDEGERLGPVHPGVAADAGVPVAPCSSSRVADASLSGGSQSARRTVAPLLITWARTPSVPWLPAAISQAQEEIGMQRSAWSS